MSSWYSWVLQSLVNGVYAFGFLFMLPQLFVNYKLKSVAHLPWRAFMYKVFDFQKIVFIWLVRIELIYFYSRRSTHSLTTFLLSLLRCRPLTEWPASEMMQSFLYTFTKDGKRFFKLLLGVNLKFSNTRLYPVDKKRVNEFGATGEDVKPIEDKKDK